ncbi:hypothetical protein QQF64_026151, partial [Cirrhinus molitorella]
VVIKNASLANITTVSSSPLVISVSVAAFAVFLLVVFCLIWRKRAGNKRGTDGSSEQTDDVTYSEVSSSGKKPVKSLTV